MILSDMVKGKTGEEVVKFLLRCGIIPASVIKHAEIHNSYVRRREYMTTKDAVRFTAAEHRCAIPTVYRAINRFKTQQ
jgi:hypothetical protein